MYQTKKTARLFHKYWHYYAMLLLPVVFYIIFQYMPIAGNIIAFRRYQPGGSIFGAEFIGLRYFRLFLGDSMFWQSFRNTLLLSLGNILIGFPIPIIFAILLNEVRSTRYKKIVQTTSYLPHFLSMVIVCGIIVEAVTPNTGLINKIIMFFGGESIRFMSSPQWFKPVYIISGIWQNMGWSAIIYIAALSGVDPQLYEAAQIDGANRYHQMWYISIASIMSTIVIMLILAVGGLLGVGYEKIILLSNELNKDAAETVSSYVFRKGLQAGQYSYATAVGLFDAVIGTVMVYLANRISKRLTENSLW